MRASQTTHLPILPFITMLYAHTIVQAKDKDLLKRLLVGLLPVKGKNLLIMFTEEVQFCLPNGVRGPHGLIDLLVGPKLHFGFWLLVYLFMQCLC